MFIYRLISVLALLIFVSACSDDNITQQEEHFEAVGMIIYDGQEKLLDYFGPDYDLSDEFASDTIFIFTSKSDLLSTKFYDEDKNEMDPPEDEHTTLDADIDDVSIVELEWNEGEEGGFNFYLTGKLQGQTWIRFKILHEGHDDFKTLKNYIVVQ
jgi:hypothetical protein